MPSVSQNASPDSSLLISPATWDVEVFVRNWTDHLKTLADESNIPFKRLLLQAEQSAIYQDTIQRWSRLDGRERLSAWRKLIEAGEQLTQNVLPSCAMCGDCCRKGSPTLQVEDLELLRLGKIPWDQLVTLRKGEPVHSPFEKSIFFLLDDRIKLREKPGTQECVFLDGESTLCSIYMDRPVQCRAQACWDPAVARQLAEQPYLTRRDIFGHVELLMDMLGNHDQRCSFEKLHAAFKELEETRGETVQKALDLLAYEDHFRTFVAGELNIPENILELVFGRSFADLSALFGFRVRQEPDGSRCLEPEQLENRPGD